MTFTVTPWLSPAYFEAIKALNVAVARMCEAHGTPGYPEAHAAFMRQSDIVTALRAKEAQRT